MAPTNPPARTLVVLRHAQYATNDPQQRLTSRGERQAAEAAQSLKSALDGRKVVVLTSQQPRAKATGYIIARALGVTPQPVPWLSAAEHADDLRERANDVLEHMAPDGALILVTHLYQIEDFVPQQSVDFCHPFFEDIPAES